MNALFYLLLSSALATCLLGCTQNTSYKAESAERVALHQIFGDLINFCSESISKNQTNALEIYKFIQPADTASKLHSRVNTNELLQINPDVMQWRLVTEQWMQSKIEKPPVLNISLSNSIAICSPSRLSERGYKSKYLALTFSDKIVFLSEPPTWARNTNKAVSTPQIDLIR